MEMKPKIVVLDAYTLLRDDIKEWKSLENFAEVTVYDRTSPEDTSERIKGCEIVLTNKVILTRKHFEDNPNLRYIGILATGTNVVDLQAAREHGIVVTNIPAYSTESVAQTVFAHLFNVVNKVAYYNEQNHNGKWSACPDMCYLDFPFHELCSMTIGIVGLGNIGMRVAAIANAFGMKVNAFTSKSADILPAYINKCRLPDLYTSSDVISLHCPLTPDTEKMINKSSISLMKANAIVINTGRGPLVDEYDIAYALREKRIQAYCTDVMSVEPPHPDNPLFREKNAFITPHLGWATIEARMRLRDIADENITCFMKGCQINVVN